MIFGRRSGRKKNLLDTHYNIWLGKQVYFEQEVILRSLSHVLDERIVLFVNIYIVNIVYCIIRSTVFLLTFYKKQLLEKKKGVFEHQFTSLICKILLGLRKKDKGYI